MRLGCKRWQLSRSDDHVILSVAQLRMVYETRAVECCIIIDAYANECFRREHLTLTIVWTTCVAVSRNSAKSFEIVKSSSISTNVEDIPREGRPTSMLSLMKIAGCAAS